MKKEKRKKMMLNLKIEKKSIVVGRRPRKELQISRTPKLPLTRMAPRRTITISVMRAIQKMRTRLSGSGRSMSGHHKRRQNYDYLLI